MDRLHYFGLVFGYFALDAEPLPRLSCSMSTVPAAVISRFSKLPRRLMQIAFALLE